MLYGLLGFVLFAILYSLIGISRMPAEDMKDTLEKSKVLLYRKFLLYPNHHDIVIYRSDYFEGQDSSVDARYWFVQRVIGLPGDSILIDSGNVYINGKLEKALDTYQKNYIIQLTDSIEKISSLKSLLDESVLISKNLEYAVSASFTEYITLKKDTNVLAISFQLEQPLVFEDNIYPYSENLKWNKHFWGPMYLPKKGDKVSLTKNNLWIYWPLIQEEEKSANVREDSLFINNQYTNEYEFKNDYYFVMGDNRDNAVDSRYLGLIKRKDIVGIVFYMF